MMENAKMRFIVVVVFVLLTFPDICLGQEWRGLKPLKSTCDDVKRVLSVDHCEYPRSTYRLVDEIIEISFVTCPCPSICNGENRGWNLPPDAITAIHRELRKGLPVADFQVNSDRWTKTTTDFIGQVTYSNDELGLTLSAVDGRVLSITHYIPFEKNKQLLCPEFAVPQPLNAVKDVSRSSWFRAYGDTTSENEKSRLDKFASELKKRGETRRVTSWRMPGAERKKVKLKHAPNKLENTSFRTTASTAIELRRLTEANAEKC
jgi:hypothetical protein